MGHMAQNKAELLALAMAGKPKPRNSKLVGDRERYLAARLNNYTSPADWTYDEGFTDQIIASGAGWLTERRVPTLNWFIRQACDLGFNGEPETDLALRSAVILLIGVFLGQEESRILTITSYPVDQVQGIIANLRKGQIWRDDGKTYVEWGDPEADPAVQGVAFICDAMVGAGRLEKSYGPESRPPG